MSEYDEAREMISDMVGDEMIISKERDSYFKISIVMTELSGFCPDDIKELMSDRFKERLIESTIKDGMLTFMVMKEIQSELCGIPGEGSIVQMLNERFGDNVFMRVHKLSEKYDEFMDASAMMLSRGCLKDKDKAGMIDGLADIQLVVFHLAHLLGTNQDKLLEMALDKAQRGEQRKDCHPHVNTENWERNTIKE